MSESHIRFYAFVGDGHILGFDNAVPQPYSSDDLNRGCSYRTPSRTVVNTISPLVSDTWLEMVLPRAHDPRDAFDIEGIHAVKVHDAGGLDAWVQGQSGADSLETAIDDLRIAFEGITGLQHDMLASAIIISVGMTTDAWIGTPIVQADYDALVLQVIGGLRMRPWANYAPIVAVVPGANQAVFKPTIIDPDNAARVRQAWMSAARKLNDVFVVDAAAVEMENTGFPSPPFTTTGLVSVGESIARLIHGYRIGGTQRPTRSAGSGFARFADEASANAHTDELLQLGLSTERGENPHAGGIGSRMFGGVHVPWELVRTTRSTHAPRDPVTGDYTVPYDTDVLALGVRVSTRGRGIMPNRNAQEVVGEIDADMPLGLQHLGGAHWDSENLVDASAGIIVYWDPKSTRHRRNATHVSLPAANPLVDGRVLYSDPARPVTYIASDGLYGGTPSVSFNNASRNRVMFLRNLTSIPRTRSLTVALCFRHVGGIDASPRYLFSAGWSGGSLLAGGWSVAMTSAAMRLRLRDNAADVDLSATTTLGTGTTYVAWVRIDLDDPSNTICRINGINSPALSSALAYASSALPLYSNLRLGTKGDNTESALFTTPFVAQWRRPLTLTEMRFVEAYLADRFSFTAPLT